MKALKLAANQATLTILIKGQETSLTVGPTARGHAALTLNVMDLEALASQIGPEVMNNTTRPVA